MVASHACQVDTVQGLKWNKETGYTNIICGLCLLGALSFSHILYLIEQVYQNLRWPSLNCWIRICVSVTSPHVVFTFTLGVTGTGKSPDSSMHSPTAPFLQPPWAKGAWVLWGPGCLCPGWVALLLFPTVLPARGLRSHLTVSATLSSGGIRFLVTGRITA